MEEESEMDEEDMEDEMMDLDAEDSYDSESPDEIPAKVTRIPDKKENIVAKVSKQVVPDSDSEDDDEDIDDKLAAGSSDEESESEDEADLAAIMA
jgi:hypothetical protein